MACGGGVMTTEWKRWWICLAWLLLIPITGNAATPLVAVGWNDSLFLSNIVKNGFVQC